MFSKIERMLPDFIRNPMGELEELIKPSTQPNPSNTSSPVPDSVGTDEAEISRKLGQQTKAEQEFSANTQRAQLFRTYEEVQKTGNTDGILGKGSTGKDVENLQRQLNDWRLANGKLPIKADGIFGSKTEEAVKEFQTATGLQLDGLAGPNTKVRLDLENSPGFQQLPSNIQDGIRQRLNSYQKDPASRDNVIKLVKDPNFNMVSTETQQKALHSLSYKPADVKHADAVIATTKDMTKLELTKEFQKLPENTQNSIRTSMFDYAHDFESKQFLSDLASSQAFGNLTTDQQNKVLEMGTLINDGRSAIRLARMQNIIQSHGFQGMDQAEKDHILNVASSNSLDPKKLDQLELLLDSPEFVNASKEDQQSQLNALETFWRTYENQ